jgi:hypothetical protein
LLPAACWFLAWLTRHKVQVDIPPKRRLGFNGSHLCLISTASYLSSSSTLIMMEAMFYRNVVSLSLAECSILVSCLAYSSLLKTDTACSSERPTERYIPEDKALKALLRFQLQMKNAGIHFSSFKKRSLLDVHMRCPFSRLCHHLIMPGGGSCYLV